MDAIDIHAATPDNPAGRCLANVATPQMEHPVPMHKLSVLIPVYNELPTLKEIINQVTQVDVGHPKELVLVDDCSTDGGREWLKAFAEESGDGLRVLFHETNRGKGAAVRTALEHARGDIVVVQDADLEYDPADYPKLMAPLLANEADVVYGSRYLGGRREHPLGVYYAGNRALTLLSNLVTGLKLSDMETCYKAFRRDVGADLRLRANAFDFEPEFTAKVARGKLRVVEVPVRYTRRTRSEGKKITWKDFISAVIAIIRYRFSD
jgi:glycosyltransferase involved in cell wall biosynthesis